jgi:hypothetical protein
VPVVPGNWWTRARTVAERAFDVGTALRPPRYAEQHPPTEESLQKGLQRVEQVRQRVIQIDQDRHRIAKRLEHVLRETCALFVLNGGLHAVDGRLTKDRVSEQSDDVGPGRLLPQAHVPGDVANRAAAQDLELAERHELDVPARHR